jgi:hypothetical protein
MRESLLLLLICTLFINCKESQEESQRAKVYRIVIARASSCWPGPYEAMSIDTNLTMQYQGVAFVSKYGCYKGTISSTTWQILRDTCSTLLNVGSDTCWNTEDARIVEMIVYSSNGVQHFYGERSCLPGDVVNLYDWLWRICGQTSSEKTDEFTLETGAQLSYDGFPRDANSPYSPPESTDTSFRFSVPE